MYKKPTLKREHMMTLSQLVSKLENYRQSIILDEGISQKELDKYLDVELSGQREMHNEIIKGGGPALDAILAEIDKKEK